MRNIYLEAAKDVKAKRLLSENGEAEVGSPVYTYPSAPGGVQPIPHSVNLGPHAWALHDPNTKETHVFHKDPITGAPSKVTFSAEQIHHLHALGCNK